MRSAKKSGYVLIQVVIALSLLVLALLFVGIKEQKTIYDLRDTGDKIVSLIRTGQQDFRATKNNSLEVKIQYKSGKASISLFDRLSQVQTVEIPKNLRLSWTNSDDNEYEGLENSYGVSLKFKEEGVYSTSDSKKGMTMYLKDKNSSAFMKITIVPTSGRVYIYDGT